MCNFICFYGYKAVVKYSIRVIANMLGGMNLLLKKQFDFLNKCYESMDKFTLYLSIAESNISCEVCLALKKYYLWSLKNTYKVSIDEKLNIKFLNEVVKNTDYKTISKLEYKELKHLVVAYYSLGEIYIEKNNREFALINFNKVIEILEESTKLNLKFFNMLEDRDDITLFELMMWSRKNLADINKNVEEALEIYESIASDRELLFLEKNRAIYNSSKQLKNIDKAYEAARNIIKVIPEYSNINKDVVLFLKDNNAFLKALEICYDEYSRSEEEFFIDIACGCCQNSKAFNIQSVEKIIKFCNLLLTTFKFEHWNLLITSLYTAIKDWDIALNKLLLYLRESFDKINYENNDYSYFPECIEVLREIYMDLNDKKYINSQIRNFEQDFIFYLINASFKNNDFYNSFEGATKLLSILELNNINDKKDIVDSLLNEILKEIKPIKKSLEKYPWIGLVDKVNLIGDKCKFNPNISYENQYKSSDNTVKLVFLGSEENSRERLLELLLENKSFKEKFESGIFTIIDVSTKDEMLVADLVIIAIDCMENLDEEKIEDLKKLSVDISVDKLLFVITNNENLAYDDFKDRKNVLKDILEEIDKNIRIAVSGEEHKELLEEIEKTTPNNMTLYRFNDFANLLKSEIDKINEKIDSELNHKKIEVSKMEETSFKTKEFEDELKLNIKEFKGKVESDLIFLREYLETKLNMYIPSIIEENVKLIDDIEDIKNIKEEAEYRMLEIINNWCSENIYKLLNEQFEVYLAKYEKVHEEQIELTSNIEENRKIILSVSDEFSKDSTKISFIALEELTNNFKVHYEDFINNLRFDVKILPKEGIIKSLKEGVRTVFVKSEEKTSNKKNYIKELLLEQKPIVASLICDKIFENIEELNLKLNIEIEKAFDNLILSVENDNIISNKIWEFKKLEHSELYARNEEIKSNILFINIEIEKYKRQLFNNMIYSEGAVYLINN